MVAASCCGEVLSAAVTERLVRMMGKMTVAMNRTILDENLLPSAMDLRVGRQFIFQQDQKNISTQPRYQRSGFRTILSMSLSGPAGALTEI